MNSKELYSLVSADIPGGAELLRDTFINYPTFEFVFPALKERKQKLYHVMEFFLECGLLRGEVYAPSENLEGIAIWFQHPFINLNTRDLVKAGLLKLVLRLGPASFLRLKQIGDVKKLTRQKLVGTDCYLLDLIGIAPDLRKNGFGRLLLESKLKQIEEKRMSCFLETSNPANIGYYQRYGFTVVDQYDHEELRSFSLMKKPGKITK